MFFYFSKIFSILFFPLPLFLLFTLFLKKNLKYIFLWIVFWLSSTNYFSSLFIQTLENRFPDINIENINHFDSAIVLGGSSSYIPSTSLNIDFEDSVDRILTALYLFQNKKIDSIILSGGTGSILQQEKPEAQLLHEYLIKFHHIPHNKIYIDVKSKNTYENIIESIKIIKDKKIKNVILITSAFHMYRAYRIFQTQIQKENLNIQILPLPVDYKNTRTITNIEDFFPSVHGLEKTTITFKEYIGILSYKWKGYL